MPTLATIEKVSKKYRISHENQDSSPTLVGLLSQKASQLLKKCRHPFTKLTPQSSSEEFWALKDINFSIEEGDKVAVIGKNGSGKSTLLKILSRITMPTEGKITIHGRVASLLEVGTGFHPELSGRENIFLNGAILGMSHKEMRQKFDDIVAFAEIEKFLDTPVKRFSSGMYTRLGFAIAAYLDPDILIVDEVLAVGDSQFQTKCLKKLNDLSQSGRTIVFVSHDIGAVLSFCNKGVFLEKGRMLMSGPIQDCVNAYMQSQRVHGSCWEGDVGDEHIRFYQATMRLPDQSREFIYQGEPIELEVEYEVFKPAADLIFGLTVWNQRNQLLARSHTLENPETQEHFVKPGKHKATYRLNSALFHAGEYLIKLESFIHNRKRIMDDDVILKLPVYSLNKGTRFSAFDGISLMGEWTKH